MNSRNVAEALCDVLDPELGVDIVSLGLVYGIQIDGPRITVEMTTTTEACPMGAALFDMAEMELAARFPGAKIVLESAEGPPWDVAMASDTVRRRFGLPPLRAAARGGRDRG